MKNEIVVHSDPNSNVSETLKIIRTNIQFSIVDQKVKTLLVTSSIHGEGKSFISANLSATFAQNKSKVLLIDCDLRNGRLHKIFEVDNTDGLSNLLIDDMNANFKKYIKKTYIDNLSIMTMGTIPPNPSELLSSPRFKVVLDILKNKFDYIILDGTPIIGLTDSIMMASLADKVVLVSTVGNINFDILNNAKQSLDNVGASIIGVIVNKLSDVQNNY